MMKYIKFVIICQMIQSSGGSVDEEFTFWQDLPSRKHYKKSLHKSIKEKEVLINSMVLESF